MESTLSVTRAEIRRRIGREFGIGESTASWTASQISEVDDYIRSGERSFYQPPILPNERTGHRWSFMQPLLTLTFKEGVGDYDLPDLFGGFVGELCYPPSSSALHRPLTQVGIGEILKRRTGQSSQVTETPVFYAVHPLETNGATPQRHGLSVWPTPDGEYNVKGQYFLNPHNTTDTAPYPLGGQPHSETLLMACMAAAELGFTGNRGNYLMQFIERLATSVSFDRATGAKFFGYNGDRSCGPIVNHAGRATGFGAPPVTYNGESVDWGG